MEGGAVRHTFEKDPPNDQFYLIIQGYVIIWVLVCYLSSLSLPDQRPCELLPSLGVNRLQLKLSV
jgi:hypothetical protein